MRLKGIVNFLLAAVAVASVQGIKESTVRERRQFAQLKHKNYANTGIYASKHPLHGLSSQQLQQQKQQQQQQYSDFGPQKYADSFNEIEGGQKSSSKPVSKPGSTYAEKSSTKTSPALSALALMGFLYFLNLIQDVLQGQNGRRKREVEDYLDGTEGMNDYITAIEGLIKKVTEVFPQEKNEEEGRGFSDIFSYFRNDDDSENNWEDRAFRIVSFMGSLLSKISEALGFGRKASSRLDEVVSSNSVGNSFWPIFGNRVGLVAKIMNFLSDPKPSRIGRSQNNEIENSDINPKEEYAEPLELSDEEKRYLPSFVREEPHSRRKRFTTDEMNIWYSEAGAESHDDDSNSFDGSGRLVGMVLNLFKEALIS